MTDKELLIETLQIKNWKFQGCVFSNEFINKVRGKLLVFIAEGNKEKGFVPDKLLALADRIIAVPPMRAAILFKGQYLPLKAGNNEKKIYQPIGEYFVLTDKKDVCIFFGDNLNGCFPVTF